MALTYNEFSASFPWGLKNLISSESDRKHYMPHIPMQPSSALFDDIRLEWCLNDCFPLLPDLCLRVRSKRQIFWQASIKLNLHPGSMQHKYICQICVLGFKQVIWLGKWLSGERCWSQTSLALLTCFPRLSQVFWVQLINATARQSFV